MTRTLACALAVTALLAGCDHHGHPTPTPVIPSMHMPADTSVSDTQIPTAPPTGVITFPTPPDPDADTRAAYLAALNLVDPDIVHGQPDKAVHRGLDQCATFLQFPDDLDRQIGIAHERFTSPTHPLGYSVGDTKYILQTVHTYLCPSYPDPLGTASPEPVYTGKRGQ